ncbi:MAG: BspA family leucine-rich repeat surface protein [Lactobacillus delbrueckii]|nr:BspA family leucine-rich repeat surface protein [Lactobacillus delbrueckii]
MHKHEKQAKEGKPRKAGRFPGFPTDKHNWRKIALAGVLCVSALAPLGALKVTNKTFLPKSFPQIARAADTANDDSGVTEWKTWGTCRWGIDTNGVLWIEPSNGKSSSTGKLGDRTARDAASVPWNDYRDKITAVKCIGKITMPLNCSNLFSGISNCKTIDSTRMDFSGTVTMYQMFANDSNLTTMDLSKWNTSKVSDTSGMFYNCSSLANIYLSNWNTSKVSDTSGMFYNCSSLANVNLSNWNTSNVTNMFNMFNGCSSLANVGNLTNWNTSKFVNTSCMFFNCPRLTSIGDLSRWKIAKVSDMSGMFYNCSSLTSIGDLSEWDTSNVTAIDDMFHNCLKLTTLGDINKWNVSSVTNMDDFMAYCLAYLGTDGKGNLDLSSWKPVKNGFAYRMFKDDSSLKTIDLSGWTGTALQRCDAMFQECRNLTDVKVPNLVTSKTQNIGGMFDGCSSLSSLDLSKWNTSGITDTPSYSSTEVDYYENEDTGYTGATNFLNASKLSTLKLGENFTINSSKTGLVTPTGDSYSGKWVRKSDNASGTANDLMTLSVANAKTAKDRAGTWTWQKAYIITFDANGGAGMMNSLKVGEDESTPLTSNAFTRKSYDFAGWNTKKDGSGTAYSNAETVKPTENMTLYAQWKKSSWYDSGMSAGIVNQKVSYVTNVTGNIADDKSVRVTPDATTSLTGGTGSIKVTVKPAKSVWSSLDVYGNENSDGSRTGTDTTTAVNIFGEARSSDIYRGTIGFNVQLVDNDEYDYTGSIQTFTAPNTGTYLLGKKGKELHEGLAAMIQWKN